MNTINEIRKAIEEKSARGAWSKGVKEYATELLEDMDGDAEFYGNPADMKALYNGADNWQQYSESGCALVYDGDIAKRLCCPSELKKTHNGDRNPNSHENWIETQTRALFQAAGLIRRIARS